MDMNLHRLLLVGVVMGCWFLRPETLSAQTVSPPFEMDKQYSAEVMVMMKDGTTLRGKTYMDGTKMRSEMNMSGMDTVIIIRKDEQKMFMVLDAQKMVMEMPYDPTRFQGAEASFGPSGKFEVVGPESSDGIPCTKYKVTTDTDKKVYYFWLDLEHKVPVRMEAEDHAVIVKWRNYKAAPQDSALFDPPGNYQVMPMPQVPGMPGAPGAPAPGL